METLRLARCRFDTRTTSGLRGELALFEPNRLIVDAEWGEESSAANEECCRVRTGSKSLLSLETILQATDAT